MNFEDISNANSRWVSGFFVGICTVQAMLEKIVYSMHAQGKPEYGYHTFLKPYFYTTMSLLGVASACLVHFFIKTSARTPLFTTKEDEKIDVKQFLIPGVLELIDCVISSITVAYLGVSVDYMLKSCGILAVALISKYYFKQTFSTSKILSLGVVGASMILIGSASIVNAHESSIFTISTGWASFVVILRILSQIGSAIKLSYDQYFMHEKKFDPSLVAGLMGTWGFGLCVLVVVPLVSMTPGPNENGIHEDLGDTFTMMKNNPLIIFLLALGLIVNCSQSISALVLVAVSSAVVRALVELLGTIIVWVLSLIIYYSLAGGRNSRYRIIGEEWTKASIIQLFGYILLVFGLLQYEGIPRLPYLSYDEHKDEMEQSHLVDTSDPIEIAV